MVQDRRVETYLQSQEEEGTDMLASIQAWGLDATASLQRLVQQLLPARPQQHTFDDYEEVSMAGLLCDRTMGQMALMHWQGLCMCIKFCLQ